MRQVVDTIIRRQENERHERMLLLQWQTRQLAEFSAIAAGAFGGDVSELVQAARELSIFPAQEVDGRPQAAPDQGPAPDHVDEEVAGVPAGIHPEELPEMVGVPAGGPQQQAGDVEVKGRGAQTGSAEALINTLQGLVQ